MSKSKSSGISIDLPGDITVHCPEDGGKLQQPITVSLSSGEIACPDVKSLCNVIVMGLNNAIPRKQGDGKQGTGPQRSWAEAAEYAEKFNKGKPEHEHITVDSARRLLAEQKRLQKLQVLTGQAPTTAKQPPKRKKTG